MGKLRKELNGDALWGLPYHISEELINAHEITLVRWVGHWLFMIIMCSGFAVGGFWIWPYLENLNNERAFTKATELNGLMFDVNFGFGLLIALFVWIFLTSAIAMFVVRIIPMPLKGTLFFGQLSDKDESGHQQIAELMGRSDKPDSATELINRWTELNFPKVLKIFLPISVLTALITYHETQMYSVYSEAGYFRSGFFSKETRSWHGVSSVELGCNQTDDGSSLVYKVNFPDKSLRIEDGISINETYWLYNLEKIDKAIESTGAKFERWQWLNRNPLHPKCLRGFYGELGPDGKSRLDKLLRINEF